MDNSDLFHAVSDLKWIYLGFIPIRDPQMGLMTFGDIELIPAAGEFE